MIEVPILEIKTPCPKCNKPIMKPGEQRLYINKKNEVSAKCINCGILLDLNVHDPAQVKLLRDFIEKTKVDIN